MEEFLNKKENEEFLKNMLARTFLLSALGDYNEPIVNLLILHQKGLLRTSTDFWIEYHLCMLLSGTKDYQVLLDWLSKGLENLEPNSKIRETWVKYYVGMAAWIRGDFLPAMKLMQQSLDLACEIDYKDMMHRVGQTLGSWCSLGNRCAGYSGPAEVVEYLKIAKDAAFHLDDNRAVWSAMWNLGHALCRSADYEEAHKIETQLSEMANSSKDNLGLAYAASLSGSIAGDLGEDDACVKHQKDVIRRLHKLLMTDKFPKNKEETHKSFLINFPASDGEAGASVWTVMDVQTMIKQAWELSEFFGKAVYEKAYLQHSQVLDGPPDLNRFFFLIPLLEGEGKHEEAEAYAADFLKEAEHVSSPLAAMALVFIAQLTQESEIIESLLDEAERITTHPNILVRVLNEQAMNFMRAGNFDKAILKFRAAAEKQVALDNEKFGGFSSGRIAYLDDDGHKRTFRALQALLMDPLKPDNNREALVWAERERSRDLLHSLRKSEKRDAYLRELAEFDGDKESAWEEIQQAAILAGEGTAILVITRAYFEMAYTHFLSWDVQQNRLLHRSSGRRIINSTIPNLVQQTVSAVKNQLSQDKSLLQFWYNMFIKPYQQDLQRLNPKKLLIIAHEEFSMLPFAAFHEAEDEPFLIEDYAISIAPSLRMYKQCILQQREQESKRGSKASAALVIGNPTIDLHYAEKEAVVVKDELEKSFGFTVAHLQRQEATKEACMKLFLESNWVHVASHAILNETYPNGALLFGSNTPLSNPSTHHSAASTTAGTSREARIRDTFDNKSYISEFLTGEDLEVATTASPLGATVVVLSACSTGLGRIRSEGVLGLTRSFHMLGVPTVLASLWDVADESTGVLMGSFYKHLKQLDVAFALQKAMVDMINEVDRSRHFVYKVHQWAPFVVYGSDQARCWKNKA